MLFYITIFILILSSILRRLILQVLVDERHDLCVIRYIDRVASLIFLVWFQLLLQFQALSRIEIEHLQIIQFGIQLLGILLRQSFLGLALVADAGFVIGKFWFIDFVANSLILSWLNIRFLISSFVLNHELILLFLLLPELFFKQRLVHEVIVLLEYDVRLR